MRRYPILIAVLTILTLGACTVSLNVAPGSVVFYVQPQSGVWTTGTPDATPTAETWLPTPTCTDANNYIVETTTRVNLRDSAIDGAVVRVLVTGTRLEVQTCQLEATAAGWLPVLDLSDLRPGYVSSQFTRPVSE